MNRIKLILPSINQQIHTQTHSTPIPSHSEWHEKGNVSLGPEWGDCFFFAEPTTHTPMTRKFAIFTCHVIVISLCAPFKWNSLGHHPLTVGGIRSWLASLYILFDILMMRGQERDPHYRQHIHIIPDSVRFMSLSRCDLFGRTNLLSFTVITHKKWRGKFRFWNSA